MPIGKKHNRVIQSTEGKTRDLPISDKLADVLQGAAVNANVDNVLVYSGGQCALGTCKKRTGSTRHDLGNAADLRIRKDGKWLDFRDNEDRNVFAAFARACARNGATGIGGGTDYMGPLALHIGFGKKAVWGANGASANAPVWLKKAVIAGWADASGGVASVETSEPALEFGLDSDSEEVEAFEDAPTPVELKSFGLSTN
jgi:hypothetical protein